LGEEARSMSGTRKSRAGLDQLSPGGPSFEVQQLSTLEKRPKNIGLRTRVAMSAGLRKRRPITLAKVNLPE
jgi:hypothetical protein